MSMRSLPPLLLLALLPATAAWCVEVTPVVERRAEAGPPQLWALYSSASGSDEIRNCGTWRTGWREFVEKRALPAAREFGAVWIHNPGGVIRGEAMKYQQFTECSQQAALSGNEQLASVADWSEFTKQISRVAAEAPLLIYLGSPATLRLTDDETDPQWLSRALDELAPVLQIDPKPIIAFDATYGHPSASPPWDRIGGPDGLTAQLLKRLTADGYEVLVEPAILAEANWLEAIAGTCATEFWWHRMLKGGKDIRVPHYKPGWGDHLSPTEVTGRQVRIYTDLYKQPFAVQRDTLNATLASGYDAAIYTGDLQKIAAWQEEQAKASPKGD